MEPIFHWGENNFICKFSGNVNLEDIQSGLAKVSGDERSEKIDYGVIDFSGIEILDTQDKDIMIPAVHDIGFSHSLCKPTKFAFIASEPKTTQFLNRYKDIVQSVVTILQIQIFDNRESAMAWIMCTYTRTKRLRQGLLRSASLPSPQLNVRMKKNSATTHTLSFGEIIILQEDIAEVIINDGVEMDLKMVGEYHEILLNEMKEPFSLLINKLNSYSYTFEAQENIATLTNINAMAVVVYSVKTEMATKTLISIPRETPWEIRIFNERQSGLNWLREKQKNI